MIPGHRTWALDGFLPHLGPVGPVLDRKIERISVLGLNLIPHGTYSL
jgi:hypothetical protein